MTAPPAVTADLPVDAAFTKGLPKIELHAHLTGSISRDCLHHIWVTKKARDPDLDLEDPLVAIPTGKVDYDIKTFFPLFSSYIYRLCSDLPSIQYSTKAVLQDFQHDGVVYVELRTTPRAIPGENVTKENYVKTILDQIKAHNHDANNTMRAFLILSIDRRNNTTEAEEVVDLAIKYQSAGVVGVDLCGDPAKGDVRIFGDSFARAKAAGLEITLHFAESETSASDLELQTLLSWQPNRLGHVIHVKEEFRKIIEQHGTGVELCLSCNVHAKMITGTYSDHHFGMWRNSSVPVALSTDDVGVFCSPLSQEYYLAAQHFHLADNYAIFALSKYVGQTIHGNFTFLPEVNPAMFAYAEIAVPFSDHDGATILLNNIFSRRWIIQLKYNTSRLQPDSNVFDVEQELEPDRKADIIRAPFVIDVPSNPGTDKSTLFNNASTEASKDDLLDIDTGYGLTCSSKYPNQHPYTKDFDRNEAVDIARTFCEGIVKSEVDTTSISPTVRDTYQFNNISRDYTLTEANARTNLGFFALTDNALFIQARNAKQFFEGVADDAKVDHCVLTYKHIISGCDTDV
ncbi:uncharacterized protein ALTATR162_LOCUS9437 [Alternaria atra]|uniref:Adenosine deaminase domain-containing protein n=1 Tax=Alternaria atra TaxID=119953 RepID=A0A8J2N5F3_9PLEO|nr:uncharacterized protein ALTATR162_LOCUS9437 [Alternaria atra]CAG5180811.1 unnamed protein product [Alternaria atra]